LTGGATQLEWPAEPEPESIGIGSRRELVVGRQTNSRREPMKDTDLDSFQFTAAN